MTRADHAWVLLKSDKRLDLLNPPQACTAGSNPPQAEVAMHHGAILVLAAAGTGKTRTRTSTIAWCTTRHGIPQAKRTACYAPLRHSRR